MLIEKKIEVSRYDKICDICQVKIKQDMACSTARCEYCGKDLCEKCIGVEKNTTGDYREVYCGRCAVILSKYQPLIDKLEAEVERLYDECIRECRNS